MLERKAIPSNIETPNVHLVKYEKEERQVCRDEDKFLSLASLNTDKIFFRPVYKEIGIEGATSICYMREGVSKLLLEATKLLPQGYTFLIYDAWRPFVVQYALYEEYYREYEKKYPEKKPEQIKEEVKKFVSEPTKNMDRPFVHATGGAIDLTIVDEVGKELDMGTEFDYFGDEAYTAYFENDNKNLQIQKNRRLLYNIMTQVGFTNLPSEWWHYDYGDSFWAYYTQKRAKYKGVVDENGLYG